MDFEIRPLRSAGSITFGMDREEARRVLNSKWRSFRRTPQAEVPHDHFVELGVFVYYKAPGVVEAVEFAPPANPIFEGISLLKRGFSEIKVLLTAKDPHISLEPGGMISRILGIGIYAPDAIDDPNALSEAVIAVERGYYESK